MFRWHRYHEPNPVLTRIEQSENSLMVHSSGMTAGRGSYQSRDGEVSALHLLSEPVHFPPCVDEDDSLCDSQRFIQVTQRVQLPLLRGITRSDTASSIKLRLSVTQNVLAALGTGSLLFHS